MEENGKPWHPHRNKGIVSHASAFSIDIPQEILRAVVTLVQEDGSCGAVRRTAFEKPGKPITSNGESKAPAPPPRIKFIARLGDTGD